MYTSIWAPKDRQVTEITAGPSTVIRAATAVTKSMPGIIGRKVTLTAD